MPSFLAAVFSDRILLLSTDGELVEQLNGAGLPVSLILQSGLSQTGHLVISGGNRHYVADDDLLEWQIITTQPTWLTAHPLPADLTEAVINDQRNHTLTLERFLLDFHSGRLFGTAGELFMDFFAVLLILSAISGIWYWLKGR